MTYIENIFLCLAIPMILSLFFIKRTGKKLYPVCDHWNGGFAC